MRALVLADVGRFELVDLPDPRPGTGEVRIRVTQSGICGSELGGFRGTDGLRHPGLVFGHELIGVVDAYGPGVDPVRLLPPRQPGRVACQAEEMCAAVGVEAKRRGECLEDLHRR